MSLTLSYCWQNMLVCVRILFKIGYHELDNIDRKILKFLVLLLKYIYFEDQIIPDLTNRSCFRMAFVSL